MGLLYSTEGMCDERYEERSDGTCKYIADRYQRKWRNHVPGVTEDNARRGL
jgi:hypothetical protein